MLHLVKEIVSIAPFQVCLLFDNNEVRVIDLKEKLTEWSVSQESKFKTLLDPNYFIQAKYDEDLATIAWDNGIDFCPDSLYSWGKTLL